MDLERISSARSYLQEQKDQLDATGLVVARYLERRFGESFGIDYAAALTAAAQTCATDKFNAPALGLEIGREIAPDDFYVARAFQCQTHPLPRDFWDGIYKYTVEEPTVGLDQATLAVQIALEQGCLKNERQVRDIQQLQFPRLEKALSSQESSVDSTYLKRFAAWLYANAGPVDENWLVRVRNAQLDSGGWLADVGDEEADPNSSMLAFWILLTAAPNQKAADVHFVEGTSAGSTLPSPSVKPEAPEMP